MRARSHNTGVVGRAALFALALGVLLSTVLQTGANAWLSAQRGGIEAMVAEVTRAPARIGGVRLVWKDFRPRLELRDARLLLAETEAAPLRVTYLRLGVEVLPLLRGEVRPNSLQLAGLALRLNQDAEGRWRIGDRERRVRPDLGDILRFAARFDDLRAERVELGMLAHGSDQPVDTFVEHARLLPERGGWRLNATLLDGERSGRLTVAGMIEGDADRPSDWRQSWQLAFDGNHDLAASVGHVLPRLHDLPRIEGGRLRAELRRQGGAGDASWLMTADLRARHLHGRQGQQLEDLRAEATGRFDDGALDVDVTRLSAAGETRGAGVSLRLDTAAPALTLRADWLAVDPVSDWLRAASGEALPAVSGRLRAVELAWQGEGAMPPSLPARYRARIDGLRVAGDAVTIIGLSGSVDGSGDSGRFVLDDGPLEVRLPDHLFAPLRMDRAAGTVRWSPGGEGGRELAFEDLAMALDSLRAEGGGRLRMPADAPPHLQLDVALSGERAADAKPFMPRRWRPELRDYLAGAIRQGTVDDGRLRFDATLAEGFWRDPDTRFDIALSVSDGRMRFHPEWPVLTGLRADLAIDARSITIDAERGNLAGLALADVRVAIPDFRAAELRAELVHADSLENWYAMLAESPLASRLRGLLEGTAGVGRARVDFALDLPLKDKAAAVAEGRIGLDRVDLRVDRIDATVEDVRGGIHFINHAVAAEDLTGTLHGRPLRAGIATEDGMPRLRAETDVDLAARDELARFVPDWLQPRLAGVLPLALTLDLGPRDGTTALALELGSENLRVDLPAPFDLVPDAGRDALRVDVALRGPDIASLRVRLPGRFEVQRFGNSTRVHLGPGRARADETAGLTVTGHAGRVALLPWLRFASERAAAATGAETAPAERLTRIDLTAEHVLAGPLSIPDLAVQLTRDAHSYRFAIDGGSRGEVRVDTGGRGELEVRFERLRLRRRPDAADGPGAPEADGDDGRDGGQRLDPRRMPSADVLVGQLVLDDLDLGQLDMRLRGLDDGLRLSNLRITDGALALDATGEWRTVPAGDAGDADGGVRMHLDADLETGAIDPLLTALGYARTLSADRFRAQASLRWSDMDALARLAGAEGTLSVEATEGNIAAVEPGAGRMLGLFNFYALPRRLGLDFRDVTASGLAFDRLAGSFALGGGQARTDDLVLDGPSLRVEVDGRVGLAARDYDQLISIYPDVSGGMTLGGAVLGGPVGVGIALLARELFETPIDAATRIQYRLVGPWDDPQFIPQDIDTPSEERSP
ncbi:AsmA-like C-terminal region-containing protein [Algiphilus sp.]|uniref:YhdP family phospholipid transporter n=1 Tax=Algiphilus sp. TaxID=1872431 RepID=UPI0025C71CEE|nr:AsmA-like C-terminal region-containing protein [Algiphilus sp.]MCK5771714.1 hypothetical protein [Algiphilus sp.]